MKFLSLLAMSIILGLAPLPAQARDTKSGVKITKNEAEHIALQHHKGARVSGAKLETIKGRKVWLIDISKKTGDPISRVSVDAITGRIVSGKKTGR